MQQTYAVCGELAHRSSEPFILYSPYVVLKAAGV